MVRTVDQYGAPSYGPIGRPVAGTIFHTPENVDPTLAQAVAVAKWQAGRGNTSGGSYHGILGHDSAKYPHGYMLGCDDPEHWVMVRSVPWNQCAGGVGNNLGHTRYPWMKQLIHPEALRDPNKYHHQIALGGKAAQYVQNGYPKGLIIAAAEWVKILEKAYSYDSVLSLHRHWQTNRSDPGPINFADLVLEEYFRKPAPAPAPAPTPKTYTQAEVDALLRGPNTRIFTKNKKIDTAIAMLEDARND